MDILCWWEEFQKSQTSDLQPRMLYIVIRVITRVFGIHKLNSVSEERNKQ